MRFLYGRAWKAHSKSLKIKRSVSLCAPMSTDTENNTVDAGEFD